MSVSTRLSLQFPPRPASENTDTLVLTFHSHYLDLRVLRCPSTSATSPSPLSPPIEWAFAGTLAHPSPARTTWQHAIDSRGPSGVDTGVSTALDNGDTLEEGEMRDPDSDTGEVRAYREVWRRVPVEREARAWCLESEEGEGKVFVGRVGLYFLALGQRGEAFAARRWQLEDGRWREVYRINTGALAVPAPGDVPEEQVREGAVVQVKGRAYVVREAYAV
ncbi:hypothetical protein GLOTRDRAFT_141311 [Gloeophyllum trabeum ATCC 11539]|uniref:Protein HRI1 n=1 Tax=Gloeophyllum trabeum (strain ATCC 11539 / FP-39264 / Madison 617) TaxID=670483 RepID=S7PTZ0_GLOTA|nr:uncharacterized protein GLOTRDRAFT_141311 [Gloeophyllum trabeum ATCC 11539]EPQ50807.1 hypothetical protein GLOTRDRAFT_141311 [Gloeophyllum trabeum ATCC 11539]